MSLLTKILIITALIANLVYFFLTGALLNYRAYYKDKLQTKRVELEETVKKDIDEITKLRSDIKSVQSKNDSFRVQMENINNAIKQYQSQLQEVQENITVLKNRAGELKAGNEGLTQNRDKLIQRNNDLQTQLALFREKQQKMQKDAEQLQEEMQKVADELATTNKNLSLLNDEYLELSKKYQFAQQSLRYYESLAIEKPIGPPNVIRGKVLAIGDSQNVVIISPGESTGVTVGTEFTVYRGDKYIGKVRVDKVDKEFSTAMVITGMMKDTITVQDDIINSPY